MTVRVTVRNVAGRLLKLDMEGELEAWHVKEAIAASWGVPAICQSLVLGSTILGDSQTLTELRPADGSPLDVTLIASLDGVCVALESGTRAQQMRALASLAELGREGRAQACEEASATACAGVPFRDPRCTALAVLRGNLRVICSVYARLEDRVASVRRAAVEALAYLSDRGQPLTVAVVHGRLTDRTACVRAAAARALPRVVERGDARALSALISRLQDRSEVVRCSAVEAVAQVARRRDREVITALGACLRDRDASVRLAAMRGLSRLVDRDDLLRDGLVKCSRRDKEEPAGGRPALGPPADGRLGEAH